MTAFHDDLRHAAWEDVFRSATVSGKWEVFLSLFLPILNQHAPMKQITIRNPTAPPVSDATKVLMYRRRRALREMGRESCEYRDLNRSVRAAIRKDTRNDIHSRIIEQGPASVWRNIRSVIQGKKGGQIVLPETSADSLNDYFVGVGPKVVNELNKQGPAPAIDCRLHRVGSCGFTLSPVTLMMLQQTLISTKSSAACGSDGLCIRIFKAAFPAIGSVILNIVNACITRSEIPASWKHSIVNPIFKNGNPSDPSNFRPISVVPVIMKIVERLVQCQLYHYLSYNHLLSPSQHGFRPRHSTETALTTVTDRILTATDSGEITLLCLIDLSKCFDVIDHSILLKKLQLYGVDTAWFCNYLRGHTQSVALRNRSNVNNISKALENSMGVLQGSALGPLLFSVFANDLMLHTEGAEVVQYADDTQVIVSGPKNDLKSLICRMEAVLASLGKWFRANLLKVNPSKTEPIVFGSPHNLHNLPTFDITFCNTSLTPCNSAKNIGLIFDSKMSWEAHVSMISRRCIGILCGLSHARHNLPNCIIRTLVTSLVISHIRYCISVYGNGSKKNLEQIQKVLNFGARVIFGRRKFDHVSDLWARLGWLRPQQLVDLSTLNLAHKIIRRGQPDSLPANFVFNYEKRERNTRQDHMYVIPRCKTETGKRRFSVRGPDMYNSLPSELHGMRQATFSRNVMQMFSV